MRQYKRRYGEPIEIEEATELLTPRAFVCFVKMLSQGRRKFTQNELPGLFDLGRTQTTMVLKELRLMKYVEPINNGIGKPGEVFVRRQILIQRKQKFVYR